MENKKAYLNLDEYQKNNNLSLEDVNTEYDTKGHKILSLNDKKYYMKPSVFPLYEVLGSEIAYTLGINTVHYIPVIYQGEKYIISPYFHKEENRYIRGDALITEGKRIDQKFLQEYGVEAKTPPSKMNSLDIIWLELIKQFPEADLESVMNDFVDKFFLTILLKNFDYIGINWELEIDPNNNLKVMPYYDYEYILCKRNDIKFNAIYTENIKPGIEVLKDFIRVSDSKYLKRLKQILDTLTPEKLNEIITIIERTFKEELPEKEIIVDEYIKNYNQILYILQSKQKSL